MILRNMRLDVCTSDDKKGNVFPGCKKSGCPGSPVPYTQVSGNFIYLESGPEVSVFELRLP
jgi:hypothetical protein